MKPELEDRALSIVVQLAETPAEKRDELRSQLCGEDAELKSAVAEMWEAHEAAEQKEFWQRPAFEQPELMKGLEEAVPSELLREHPASTEETFVTDPNAAVSEATIVPPPNGIPFVSGQALAAGQSPNNVDPNSPVASAKPLVSGKALAAGQSPDNVDPKSPVAQPSAKTSSVPPDAPRVGRFDPKELLGVGGQGEVWRVTDPHLDRDVALKVVKPGLKGSQPTLAKFKREAEVTGKLEHPCIVPVYEAGSEKSGGAPFYVMRILREKSLQVSIDEFHQRDPSPEDYQRGLRGLLDRFIDVCEALGYAHSRGVIHRDLKPVNVMLGDFGETLVVDWGMAKVTGRDELHRSQEGEGTVRLDPDDSKTRDGAIIGTPRYMSPEQARGEIAELKPATDIYGLGAILYAILTGQPPIGPVPRRATTAPPSPVPAAPKLNIHEILAKVRKGEIPDPTTIDARVPKPLAAVCLKALALEPQDRYRQATDIDPQFPSLAGEIRRWLNDEPVTAWTEPFTVRAKRLVKRNQTFVTATAAAVLMAAVTLSAMFVVVSGQKAEIAESLQREQEANQRERDATKLAQANEQDADRQRVAAQAARATAEANEDVAKKQSQLALKTVKAIIYDFDRELHTTQVGNAIKRRLLSSLLDSVADLSTEYLGQGAVDRANEDTLLSAASALAEIGLEERGDDFVARTLASLNQQGKVKLTPESKRGVDMALEIYKRIRDQRQARYEACPMDASVIHDLAYVLNEMASAYNSAGDTKACVAQSKESLKLLDIALRLDDDRDRNTVLRMSPLFNICCNSINEPDELERYIPLLIEAAKRDSDNRVAKAMPALAVLFELASSAVKLDLTKAESKLGLLNQAVSELPVELEDYRDRFRLISKSMAILVGVSHQPPSIKVTDIDELVAEADRLANAPLLSQRAASAILSLYETANMAAAAIASVNLSSAISKKQVAFAERLLAQQPDDLNALFYVYSSKVKHAQSLANAQRHVEVEKTMSGLLEQIVAVTSKEDADDRWLGLECSAAQVFVTCGLHLARSEQILKYSENQIRVNTRLLQRSPKNMTPRIGLALSHNSAAAACQSLGLHAEAITHCNDALKVIEQLPAEVRDTSAMSTHLAIALWVLNDAYVSESDYENAQKAAFSEIAVRRKLVAADSNSIQSQRELCLALERAGSAALKLGQFDEAIKYYGESLTTRKTHPTPKGGVAGFFSNLFGGNSPGAPSADDIQKEFAWLEERIRSCEKAKIATGDWETLLRADAKTLPSLLSIRATELANRGQLAEVVQTGAKLRELSAAAEAGSANEQKGGILYNAACAYGLCATLSLKDKPQPTDSEKAEQQKYLDLSLACLKEAVAAGYDNFDHIEQDTDLTPLRQLKEFQELLKQRPAKKP